MNLVWSGGERRIPNNYEGFSALKNSCVMTRLNYVLPYLKKEQTVVDLGCGTGWNTKLASLYCLRMYGIDISSEALEYARKVNDAINITRIQTDMYILEKIESNSVDLILSIAAIEHITEDNMKTLFQEAYRISKPDSFFVGTLTAFRNSSMVDVTKWHKYEPSMDDFKSLSSPYYTTVGMDNFKLNTPDLVREYTEGMFVFKRRDI